MKKASRLIAAIVVIGAIGGFLILRKGRSSAVQQPVQFNHRIHIEQGLECMDCHQLYRTHKAAGRPQIETCAMCHADMETDNPEAQKIIDAVAQEREIPWKRITKMPGHVYFSHRTHAELAQISCETCHGDVASQISPPSRPLKELSMQKCMSCHQERQVTNDCLACHK